MIHASSQPRALAVGPKKSGTSWIHAYLAARGDICLPLHSKETFFFDRYHDRGISWYRRSFAHYDPALHKLSMEVAPTLFHHSEVVPSLVRSDLGDIPIVITLRHPLERAWSHYKHVRRASTRKSLQAAVRDHPEILHASRYAVHVPRWQEAFSRVAVLKFDELAEERVEFVARLERALGLPAAPQQTQDIEPVNVAKSSRYYFVAYTARHLKRGFRSFGLHWVVDALKRPVVERFVYMGGCTVSMSDEDRAFLERELREQLREWHAGG